jgi:phosphoglycolate phosphatase
MSLARLVVFDLDGTLVDSRRDLAESANALLEACGCGLLEEAAIGRMVGDGAAVLVARAFAASGCAPPADALQRFLELYNGRLLRFTRTYPGIPEVLPRLAARAMMAVLTNKPIGPTRQILEGLDLAQYFDPDAILGGDGPLPRKPHPDGLRTLLARAAVADGEAVLVGDPLVDLRTARAAGVPCCLVRYGFGFDTVPPDELNGTTRVVDHPIEFESL